MSRPYKMQLRLILPPSAQPKREDIIEALTEVWDAWEDWEAYTMKQTADEVLFVQGNSDLSGGMSEDAFVEEVCARVWSLAGEYIVVHVNAIHLAPSPYSHTRTDKEYQAWKNTQSKK